MSEPTEAVASTESVLIGGKPTSIVDAQRAIRSSASWFWWVAGLSLVNTAAVWLDLEYGMLLGLGITQVIDALFMYGLDGTRSAPGAIGGAIHLLLVLGIAGVFVLFGHFARRGSVAAFVTGMVLYALDALLFLATGDWI